MEADRSSLQAIIAELHGGRNATRARAAAQLGYHRSPEAVEALEAALADGHPTVRVASAMSLAALHAITTELPAFTDLVERIRSRDPVRCRSGVRGLLSLLESGMPKG